MRDAHRMKEKFDLSLDNRQIVSLLVAGVVVLGSVFVLGVVVGKKLATQELPAEGRDRLTALDEKAAAMDEVRDASLTFQEELTRKGPPNVEAPTVTVVEAPPQPELIAKAAPAVDASVDPAPAQVAVAPKEEPAKPAGKVADAKVATRTTNDGGQRDGAGKRPVEAAPNGAFTLQLSASQSKAEADRFATKLRDRGYAPFLLEAQVAGKGTWYRVRMGSFPTREAATRYLQDFRRETQLDAFVTAM